MLNLDLLRVFISVAENSGFTRAAGELHRSQSAISMQIKRLEELLGVPVFERNAKSIVLTPEGTVLIGYARRILHLVDEAFTTVSKKSHAQTVRLGCIEDYAARILPKILTAFWAEHPDVHIEVDTGDTPQLLKRLGDELDIVLAAHPRSSGEGEVLCIEPLIWATSAVQSPHQLDPVPVALPPEGCLERQWATIALDAGGRPWRCAYVSAATGTLLRAVEEGLAISVFKESTITGRLRRLTAEDGFPPLPDLEITLHTSTARATEPVVTLLAEKLANSLGRTSPRAID
jgi:DNA-binding transcriptional LysR family regulator